ncbi:hypothetical protein EIK77_003084 [Talaromyces pinophilus]|nr:hypothetical protein EIK77_003084 [Talaromyces pinophilus]
MAQNAFDLRETSHGLQNDWNDASSWQAESPSMWQAPTPGFLSSVASDISFQAESLSESYATTPLRSDHFSVDYAVEWKVTINKRPVGHETEQVSEMKPRRYWETYIKPKIDELLENQYSDKTLQIEDTKVIVSVNERGYKNKRLIRQFPKVRIDWYVVENQLVSWAGSFPGRDLLVQITVNHKGITNQASANHRGRVNKRGASSATQRMLVERDEQIRAEEGSLGRPSPWKAVYNLMRCPGPPCRLGPHCWRDPKDKIHHKLLPNHLKDMVQYVEQGGTISDHDDVPDFIRQEIVRAEEQRQNKSKSSNHRGSSYPPINITNVLPTPPTSVTHQITADHELTLATAARLDSSVRLTVHGYLDQAVLDYTDWKVSQAISDIWKDGFRRAGAIALQLGLDLDLLYKKGKRVFDGYDIPEGLVEQYVRDIPIWIENHHRGDEEV